MTLRDSDSAASGLQPLPAERGFVLLGAGAVAEAERLFGTRLTLGQASHVAWLAGAPPVLVIPVEGSRVELRIPDTEPWVARLQTWLAGHSVASDFDARLAGAIGRLESWQESEADGATGPQELAAELAGLRPLAPSTESEQAIVDALEALDDGLPADAVAAALYRARVSRKPG